MHRVLGVLEIDQLPRARRAVLAAGSGKSLGDAVVAESALVHRLFLRMQVAAAIRAGLDTIPAPETVRFIHQDDAVRADECGADRADLHARGIHAMVAELGNEES